MQHPASPSGQLPQAVIADKGAARLLRGHPWVYASDIVKRPGEQPCLVQMVDERAKSLGQALYSPRSKITLRKLAGAAEPVEPQHLASFVLQRVRSALQRRRRVLPHFQQRDAFRLVHGEADFLPGIFADCYADAVVLQSTCAGSDLMVEAVAQAVRALLSPRAIIVRNDMAARAHEKLSQQSRMLLGNEQTPLEVTYHEGDVAYHIDLRRDQKTGGFLDQVDNHLRARSYAHGQALDLCTYHGGFALQLAQRSVHCLAYDLSELALGRARQNAARRGLANLQFELGNIFDVLPALNLKKARFDTIVLDPPAFASGKKTVDAALRAYKEVNRRAMRLAQPGGILITCSCSGRVTGQAFDAMLESAAVDANRSYHTLERLAAGADHPVLSAVPETDYLKVRVLQVI